MAKEVRTLASKKYRSWSQDQLSLIHCEELASSSSLCDASGIFLITGQDVGVYAGEAENLQEHLSMVLDNPEWKKFDPGTILIQKNAQDFSENYALKSALVRKKSPLLNSKVWLLEDTKKSKPK